MVVEQELDLAYLGFFLGLRMNELVAQRLTKHGFGDVRQSHGYAVQHLIERERTITELARRMEVTQQAVSKVVAEMRRLGIVETASATDRRAKVVRLSERGWRSVKLARRVRVQIEARLVKQLGEEQYRCGKQLLLAALAELGGIERIRTRRIKQPG